MCAVYNAVMGISKKFDHDFFKKWAPEMAYTLGFLFADGNVIKTRRGTYYVAWHTADLPLLQGMRNALSSEHAISQRSARCGNVYRLQIGSKGLVTDLEALGLLPGKATRMRFPDVPEHFLSDFVRGYFDGDGNVWMGDIHKNRKTAHCVLRASFTSASHEFLQGLLERLYQEGLQGGCLLRLKDRNCSRLTFSTKDTLKLASIMYNGQCRLHLDRKRRVFKRYKSIMRE